VSSQRQRERLFPLPQGACCGRCILRPWCGSTQTDQVCLPNFDAHSAAGIEALHPMRTDFNAYFDGVDGVSFDDIVAMPQQAIALGEYLPQVRMRPALLLERIAPIRVGVRLDDVLRHGRVCSASDLRHHLGLASTTHIVLLLFTHDRILERFADGAAVPLDDIAAGGYEAVVSPSYSLWEPRRRPDNLLSLRRSMLTYEALQARGVNAIPRVGWVEQLDMERFANWLNANPCVDTVAIDLMSYRAQSLDRHTRLMAEFDQLTNCRIRYLINGVRATGRIAELYVAAAPERITITDATTARVPRTGANGQPQRGFRARVRDSELRCQLARRLVHDVEQSPGADEFLAAQLKRTEAHSSSRRKVATVRPQVSGS
jgi:hypothetical protein